MKFFKKVIKKRSLVGFLAWFPFILIFILQNDFRQSFERLSWGRKRMEKFELEKLKEIISFAFEKSSFYHNLYTKAGVSPDDLVTLEDIQKFPIVSKEQLHQAVIDKSIFTSTKQAFGTKKTSTSGSSGNPQILYYDFNSRKQRFFNGKRALFLMGAFPEKKFALLWRKKKLSKAEKIRSFLGLFKKISVIDVMKTEETALNKEAMHQIMNNLVSFNPKIIRGYTSALWVVSRLVKKYNFPLKTESIITSAEYLPPIWKKEMEEVFKCPINNLYGGTEGSPIAGSFSGENELAVFQDFYFTEIVDKNGEQIQSEKPGRVIITDYYSKYMPLIRYDIGDIAEWDQSKKEGPFPYFKQVHGRINDIFILPGEKILFSHNWHVYIREAKSISRFKVIQREINRIDIFYELTPNAVGWEEELKLLKEKIVAALGKEVVINWQQVDQLELDKGDKFRCVRSELNTETIIHNM